MIHAATIHSGSLLYLDTNVFIYASEGSPLLPPAMNDLLLRVDAGDLSASSCHHFVTNDARFK